MHIFSALLFGSLALSVSLALGHDAVPTDTVPQPVVPVKAAPAAAPSATLFSMPVLLRGSLGDQQIQANVRPKVPADEGIEGEYFVFGRSQKILLAGELEGEEIFMEESENGTDVSGQWDGKREGDTIRGTWLSANGSISKPFALTVIRNETKSAKTKPRRAVKPAQ